ncbi:membrane protein, partial [Mycobacterium marinum]
PARTAGAQQTGGAAVAE